ncbi:TPA: hypothetical protein RQK21_002205 [Vibrio vulnificus]|uniref:hypothetical protein n=1 Tax=Vibrio vulnificus TaxID=672 RepID=UPI001A1883E1|nr:hypothetical protein [Vibrio vulnificus]EHU9448055.1 hypothetical protein [Vibrio vulnificus]MCG6299505.1 hypothetical protein [Vibrio vulnificus]HAS6278187.1 hypothetical protein [Vibrio vulnificus]HAS8559264.1 hypothetical protein [Vibrio vulnificus]HDY7531998.1 hypothetical protein [Vibrio vulnificus]
MRNVLFLGFLLMFLPFFAKADIEEQMYSDLNLSISTLGEKIEHCRKIALENKPSESTISYLKDKSDSFFSILPYVNYLAMEKCTLEQKKNLAYVLLYVKSNSSRETTINLIKSTEKLTFSVDHSQKVNFESLDQESKAFILSNDFFSKPFDVLGLFEKVTEE